MSNPIPLQLHSYDLLLSRKNPMALRLNDAQHHQIQVGDLVEFSGHDTIMDRERFRVVGKMHHPTIHAALSSIEHSNLDTRDKIKMSESFLGTHGPEAGSHPVVALHLEPHPGPPAVNRSIGTLG
jgi:hypothetical protein